MSLIKAGPSAREQVMKWISDALLVNRMADAIQPDPSKMGTMGMLQNLTLSLLKLCEPFVFDMKKHHLIDIGFMSSPKAHRGVFSCQGDEAIPRLGDSGSTTNTTTTTTNSGSAGNDSNNETMM